MSWDIFLDLCYRVQSVHTMQWLTQRMRVWWSPGWCQVPQSGCNVGLNFSSNKGWEALSFKKMRVTWASPKSLLPAIWATASPVLHAHNLTSSLKAKKARVTPTRIQSQLQCGRVQERMGGQAVEPRPSRPGCSPCAAWSSVWPQMFLVGIFLTCWSSSKLQLWLQWSCCPPPPPPPCLFLPHPHPPHQTPQASPWT